jgi:hypothetical protein
MAAGARRADRRDLVDGGLLIVVLHEDYRFGGPIDNHHRVALGIIDDLEVVLSREDRLGGPIDNHHRVAIEIDNLVVDVLDQLASDRVPGYALELQRTTSEGEPASRLNPGGGFKSIWPALRNNPPCFMQALGRRLAVVATLGLAGKTANRSPSRRLNPSSPIRASLYLWAIINQ